MKTPPEAPPRVTPVPSTPPQRLKVTPSWLLFAATGALASSLAAAACGGDSGGSTDTGGATQGNGAGSGAGNGMGGAGQGGGLGLTSGSGGGGIGGSGGAGGECGTALQGIVRDFQVSHPDFEDDLGTDLGIVEPLLGDDGKPVYAGDPATPTTSGREAFDQWYRDEPGVNQAIPVSITLEPAGDGLYAYDNSAFFPIDDQGFGNEGNIHNYHFTYEIHTEFDYKGGEVFNFRGDDDVFTFINGHLAIDLGGVHGPQSASVDLDARSEEFGIAPGNRYTLDFFFAERHTSQSNFRIETSIECFTPVEPPQ
ncbi:fibro-slime domain-containing protein [Chondromyces apiculatus]|uniref:PA14 domain-containing protein n=1 Tax=Chondromyces apiculatus DSM 436 TaxID=1192034 RepID=A0A017TD75_9BACT|nr:fibro-slime domain-containing protein [Chondromyces apiculatus]EYF07248.1 Hypothetical protein CAP_0727 [Chondromyces apiculatus DSM 436]